ncbi:MAG: glycosyltransferase [Clostridiaceae bacterium]|nr:glycosyltransferase [Clostridiaceae bacterium]
MNDTDDRKLITIMTPCYNEAENVKPLFQSVARIMAEQLPEYRWEHLFIDNCSTDHTVDILKGMAADDPRIKIIVNARNFGHIRSPYYGLLQSRGDAVISMAADFQEPPDMIPRFVRKWEEGNKVVVAVKKTSKENRILYGIRSLYYKFVRSISDVELIDNYTGFGLYDQRIIEEMRKLDDPYPYIRGLICEIGFKHTTIEFDQPKRIRGITKNNFYTLYDMAMLGITSHSKLPLRLATMVGFILSALSLLVAVVYLILKLVMWQNMPMGTAPILIGVFFFSAVQLFFIGILGEYILIILTQVQHRPLVVEAERVNFPPDHSTVQDPETEHYHGDT